MPLVEMFVVNCRDVILLMDEKPRHLIVRGAPESTTRDLGSSPPRGSATGPDAIGVVAEGNLHPTMGSVGASGASSAGSGACPGRKQF